MYIKYKSNIFILFKISFYNLPCLVVRCIVRGIIVYCGIVNNLNTAFSYFFGKLLPYVNENCRWILISTLDGVESNLPLRAILTKNVTVRGSMLRKRSVTEKSALLSELVSRVFPKLEDGTLKPRLHAVLPINNATEAHAILSRGENVGKVVLTVPQE